MKDTLNERERIFVETYMATSHVTKAAIAAGYSRKTAASMGSQLLKKLKIQNAIKERQSKDPRVMTREERQALWSRFANDETQPAMVRIRAAEILGKSQGDFVDKKDIREDVVYQIEWLDPLPPRQVGHGATPKARHEPARKLLKG